MEQLELEANQGGDKNVEERAKLEKMLQEGGWPRRGAPQCPTGKEALL